MLSRRLVRRGFEVVAAVDGREGVDMAFTHAPDLILMDLNLPVLDGLGATREIRSAPNGNRVPIVALTAHAMAEDRAKAVEAGCSDYVTKPVDMDILLGTIQRLLGDTGE